MGGIILCLPYFLEGGGTIKPRIGGRALLALEVDLLIPSSEGCGLYIWNS